MKRCVVESILREETPAGRSVGGGLVWGMVLLAAVEGIASGAIVSVNPTAAVRPVPANSVGLHTSVYSNLWGESALPGLIDQSGVQMLRYPGGSYADAYHWTDHFNSQGYQAPDSDFANFARVMTQSSSAGMVTVNYGSSIGYNAPGSPQAAAAWVAYANASPNNRTVLGKDSTGRDWFTAGYWASLRTAAPLRVDDGYNYLRAGRVQPLGIKHWEVGNEIFGNGFYLNMNWEMDLNSFATGSARANDPNLSPTRYGQRFVQFANLMKAVDPTIKVGAVLTGPGDTGDTSNPATNWNRNVLLAAGPAIDFGIIHAYPYNVASNPSQIMNSPGTRMPAILNKLRTEFQTFGGRDPNTVEYHLTEFGNFGDPLSDPMRVSYVANTYATAMTQGFSSAHYLEMSANGFLNDSTLAQGAAYHAIRAVSRLMDDGGMFISATSDVSTLRVFAALQQDGQYAITLINQSQTASEPVTISLPITATTLSGQLFTATAAGFTQTAVSGLSSAGFSVNVPSNAVYTYVLSRPGGGGTNVVPEPGALAPLAATAWALLRRTRRSSLA